MLHFKKSLYSYSNTKPEFFFFFPLLIQAGSLQPDVVEGSEVKVPDFRISYKPQTISPKSKSTVQKLLQEKIHDSYVHSQFISDVMRPLMIEQLMDKEVANLSGGDLQRVALCLCLGKVCVSVLLGYPLIAI